MKMTLTVNPIPLRLIALSVLLVTGNAMAGEATNDSDESPIPQSQTDAGQERERRFVVGVDIHTQSRGAWFCL